MLCVRWNNEYSDKFYIQNGVRQGGILSPLLYNIYVNNLSKNLNKVPAGCCINNVLINHLMYADDVVLIAPSMKGLQKLIDHCFLYGQDHNISFNTTKTVCMAVSKKGGMAQRCEPCLYLGSERILCVDKHKYLGYIMSNDTSDIRLDLCMSVLTYLEGSFIVAVIILKLCCLKAIAPVCMAQVCGAISQNPFSVV